MPAAQSFIQILGTFLATLFIFCSHAFSFIKNSLFIKRTAKSIGSTGFSIQNLTIFNRGGKYKRGVNLKI